MKNIINLTCQLESFSCLMYVPAGNTSTATPHKQCVFTDALFARHDADISLMHALRNTLALVYLKSTSYLVERYTRHRFKCLYTRSLCTLKTTK